MRRMLPATLGIVILALLLTSCDLSDNPGSSGGNAQQTRTFSGSSNGPITYSTSAHDVLIRTFYGGGLSGTLELSPEISIYGDGTYILGLDRQGQLTSDALQQLLDTIVDKDGLLNFTRQQFADIPDQNATFLELSLNGRQEELMYGSFGNTQESAQDLDEYHLLGQVLTAITEALKGPTQPYKGTQVALLVRQSFSPDLTRPIPAWSLADFTLAQAAVYECGVIPPDEVGLNPETACLKYTIPQHAILLTPAQLQAVRAQLNGQQGTYSEQGLYYTVVLRPLLPDEVVSKSLAMFGSAQQSYTGVPLLQGTVPSGPTPTPAQ